MRVGAGMAAGFHLAQADGKERKEAESFGKVI
jgi:hypothetical protein